MTDVALDANVLVAWFDAADTLHAKAKVLLGQLQAAADRPVFLDVCIGEAVSVTCRRARQRKGTPPDLAELLRAVRGLYDRGEIRFVGDVLRTHFVDVLAVVAATGGLLNVNDALLVVLQRQGVIGDLASFDAGFDVVDGFRRRRIAKE
jgi:predicted nucleic acid-binding protein